MKKKVFLDSDIILDYLSGREPFCTPAAHLFELAAKKKVVLYTSAVVLSNVFYFLRKDIGNKEALKTFARLRKIVRILKIDEKTVDLTLHSKFTDFEDGLQYFAAKQNKVPILITRNTGDYKEKQVLVQTADEFVSVAEGLDV